MLVAKFQENLTGEDGWDDGLLDRGEEQSHQVLEGHPCDE